MGVKVQHSEYSKIYCNNYGERWQLRFCEEYFVMYINIKLLCYIPETNLIMSTKNLKEERGFQ